MDNKGNTDQKIDPKTEVGAVRLAVRDLPKMSKFYEEVIGLDVLSSNNNEVDLGIDGQELVRLHSKPDGTHYPTSTGLFHLAIRLPSRPELGRWLLHFSEKGLRLDGVGDHLVSEALYLTDPEGNGIEMYRDRPRETWEYTNGQIKMDTLPVDVDSMVKEAAMGAFEGLPPRTKMGHIHLQVRDVGESSAFYRDVLGFDLVAQWPGAGFLSAGGYHHHIGMNTWRSYGANSAPADALGLLDYEIILSNQQVQEELQVRLNKHQVNFDKDNGLMRVKDPAGIWINFIT